MSNHNTQIVNHISYKFLKGNTIWNTDDFYWHEIKVRVKWKSDLGVLKCLSTQLNKTISVRNIKKKTQKIWIGIVFKYIEGKLIEQNPNSRPISKSHRDFIVSVTNKIVSKGNKMTTRKLW